MFYLIGLLLNTQAHAANLSPDTVKQIGEKIFHNECAGKKECLVSWNDGEDFASLGIGHFIWYPPNQEPSFEESFPSLLQFMQTQGIILPHSLNTNNPDAPWPNKQQFLAEFNSSKTQQLIDFLNHTKDAQITFIIRRLRLALPLLLKSINSTQQVIIRYRFEQVASSTQGLYALIDYVNFKGEGINPSERYEGRGWGLLQVLQHMDASRLEQQANQTFADAAEKVLRQRISLSPPGRNEQRWLPGWLKRIQTYR